MKNLAIALLLVLSMSSTTLAGYPGEYPDLKTKSGGDGPYNNFGYSPKGMRGVIRGDGTYMYHGPQWRDWKYYNEDPYAEEIEEQRDESESMD